MREPTIESSGSLDLTSEKSTLTRGPVGDFFGRTARYVGFSRMTWDIPMSDDESLTVHERMAPAIDPLDISLPAAQESELNYDISRDYRSPYTGRTDGGRYRASQHRLASAIDINSNESPYSGESV
jgi:hypothetical protein